MMPVVCVVSAVQIWNYVGQGVLYAIKIIEFTPAIMQFSPALFWLPDLIFSQDKYTAFVF